MGAVFGRLRSMPIHTDAFSQARESSLTTNTRRYRQKSMRYLTIAHKKEAPPPDTVIPFVSSASSTNEAPSPETKHTEEKETRRPSGQTMTPGNALVALKYGQRPEDKVLLKASSAKALLMTNNVNPAKYRRLSICPDLGANLSMSFTVDVLADPITLKLMMKFSEAKPYAVARLLFWSDAQHLRSLPSAQYTEKVLRKIYEKFLAPESSTPICVPTGMLKTIRAAFESPNGIQTAGIYAEAHALCLRDLEKDVFPRFLKHRLYKEMLAEHKVAPASKWKIAVGALQAPLFHARENHDQFVVIMADDSKMRFFKSYCVENMTLENLMFHLDVEEAKRLPNQSFVQARARKIIDTYFRPSAKQFINLPDRFHQEILHKYEANVFEPAMFIDAQYAVMECLRQDVWIEFSSSSTYVRHIQESSIPDKELESYVPSVTTSDIEILLSNLNTMSSSILLQKAMELQTCLMANIAKAHQVLQDTALILLQDKIAHRIFKQYLRMRGKDHYVSFIDDVEEYCSLPGIEFMQHTAKKLFRKYLSDNARLQVDMSNKMRQEIEAKLETPSTDMFKPVIVKVKTGLLQDSLLRYLTSPIHSEIADDPEIPHLVREMTIARDSGKLELPHLDSVLGNNKYLMNFRKFLSTQHAAENLIFLEEVDEFRRLPSTQIVLRNAKKIVDKYINRETSKVPLPLTRNLYDKMMSSTEGMDKSFFTDAVHDIMRLLRSEEVPEFLDAPMFMILVGAWATLDETYARKQLVGDLELAYFRHRFHAICETKRDRPKETY